MFVVKMAPNSRHGRRIFPRSPKDSAMRRTPVSTVFCLAITLAMTGCSRTQEPPRQATTPQPSAPATAAAQPAAPQPPVVEASGLDALVKTLTTTDDSRLRVVTIDEIANLGQNARPALDPLVKATADPEPRVRWHAARAIGLIGEDASTAVPALVTLLADPDPVVAAQAAAAIGNIRADEDDDTITAEDTSRYAAGQEAVAKAIVHPQALVRRAAVRAIRHFEPAPDVLAPLFAKQLGDADPSVVLPALHTLADMKEIAVPVLVEALKNPQSRYWAAIALAEIGEEAAAAANPLAQLAAEGEVHERLQAILALAAIGEKAAAPAAPALIAAVQSPDKSLRFPATFALGKLRAADADAVLQKVAAEEDEVLAATASWALAQIHRGEKSFAADAEAKLLKTLASGSPAVREGVIAGLSDLAPQLDEDEKKKLAATFTRLLTDADPGVGQAAGAALIRLGGVCVETLRGKLADPAVRTNIMEVLAGLGPAAKPALDDLIKELGDADAEHASEAAVAIAAIGPDAAAAVPALRRLVADTKAAPGLRYSAAYALGRIGPAAKETLADLRGLADTEDELMATVAVWAALKVAPEETSLFERAIPLLRRALRAERHAVRLEAAVALGDIGPAAGSAIPLLELVAEDDPAKDVRRAAAEAAKKIRP
jgi:HEAT repeat protein